MTARAIPALALAWALAPGRAGAAPADLELGPRLGARLNLGGLANGGVEVGGAFLYRVSERVWIDSRALIVIGGSGKSCYLGRDLGTVCDPQLAGGAGFTVLAGPRWFLPEVGALEPHVGAGVGLSYVSFTGDEYGGVALPLWIGGGGRAEISRGVSVGGELVVLGGPASLGRDQGLGPFVSVSVLGSVDFAL